MNTIEDDPYFYKLREDIIDSITPDNFDRIAEMGNRKKMSWGKCINYCLLESLNRIEKNYKKTQRG